MWLIYRANVSSLDFHSRREKPLSDVTSDKSPVYLRWSTARKVY